MPTAKLTTTIIEAAIHGFEAQKKDIDVQIAELRAMLTGTPAPTTEKTVGQRKGRKLSPDVIARMRAAQQARWAKVRGESAPAAKAAPTPAKPKRKLSAAGRANIVAAAKKRWAAEKADK